MREQPPLPRETPLKHLSCLRRWLLLRLVGKIGREIIALQDARESAYRLGYAAGRKAQSPVIYALECDKHPYPVPLSPDPEHPGVYHCSECEIQDAARHTDPIARIPAESASLRTGETGVLEAIKARKFPTGRLARAVHAPDESRLGDDTRKFRRVILARLEKSNT